ncbi:MAG: hypothetical protein QM710_01735 [Flavobacterium sp.]
MCAKRFILIIGLLLSGTAFAKHCGWDGIFMFCVKVTDSAGKPIDNLKLTLLDSIGNPIIVNYSKPFYDRFEAYPKSDTLIFGQNLNGIKSDNDTKTRHLKLAGRNYFAFFPYGPSGKELKSYQIRIEDKTKTYYTKMENISDDAAISLCRDRSVDSYITKIPTFILEKRQDYMFSPLKIAETISDKKKIEAIKANTDYPLFEDFFIAYSVDKTNVGFTGLFKKKGNKFIVYYLSYDAQIFGVTFEKGRLTFSEEYHFGSQNHFEANSVFHLVDLKNLRQTAFTTMITDENWDEDYQNKDKCAAETKIEGNLLTITTEPTEDHQEGFVSGCIEEGEYMITKDRLIKVK